MPQPAPGCDPILTAEQAAQYGSWTVRTITNAIAAGKLRASLPNGRRGGYRIKTSWIHEWIDACEITRGEEVGEAATDAGEDD